MSRPMFKWAEDDFSLPLGVERFSGPEPTSGRTYIMYHGTYKKNEKSILARGFSQSEGGMLGRGVYLSRDLEKARKYPLDEDLDESQRVVFMVQVNVGKVIAINKQGHRMQETWHDFGYDTAWVPPNCHMVKSEMEENCIWDPKRIIILKTISPQMMFKWAEDDFSLPPGVERFSGPEPTSGRTYVMYHGTYKKNEKSIQANGFSQSEGGMLGRGVYLSRDLQKASKYPLDVVDESQRVVFKLKVNVGKVIAINTKGHPMQYNWHDHDYDTAWVPPKCGMVRSGLEENCIWDPKRIVILKTISPQMMTSATPLRGYQ